MKTKRKQRKPGEKTKTWKNSQNPARFALSSHALLLYHESEASALAGSACNQPGDQGSNPRALLFLFTISFKCALLGRPITVATSHERSFRLA